MSNINSHPESLRNKNSAWINGSIGVLIFSGSLPATKVAVLDFNPLFLTFARATFAGILALFILMLKKEKLLIRRQILSLMIVSVGCIVGFPLLTALALQHITSAHSIVFLGMLPLSTAIFGVVLGGDRPHPAFWLFSVLGSLFVIGYAIAQGISASPVGDIFMLLAIILCGLGYAEGARLSKTIGGWQVISWALVMSLPIMATAMLMFFPPTFSGVRISAWFALAYVSMFSMLIGFIFWYRGLAQGGTAAIGQLQLLQPFLGLTLAATLLDEQVDVWMAGVSFCVIICVALSKRFAR